MTDPKLPFVLGQEIHEAVEGLNELVRAATLTGLDVKLATFDPGAPANRPPRLLSVEVSMPIHPEER